MTESIELYNDMSALLKEIGLELVDIGVSRTRGSMQARAVVYRAGGTGIEECSKAHRLISNRLEEKYGETDFHLETASPGVDRTIVAAREYAIFKDRGVRLILDDEGIVQGQIVSSDGLLVLVSGTDGVQSIPIDRIRKGKLDYSQEGR
jgi:ribosome maturation factor RimP